MAGLNYQLLIPPTVEPVSLSLAKKQLRVDIPDDDYLIQTKIEEARDYCESFTNRAFYPQTWELYIDSFPYGDYRSTVPRDQRNPYEYSAYWNDLAIRLPKPMAKQVIAVNYLDALGNPQVLDPSLYYVDYNSRPCRLTPQIGGIWPMTQFYLPGSISIPFVAASYANMAFSATLIPAQVDDSGPYIATIPHQVLNPTTLVVTDTAQPTPHVLSGYTIEVINDGNGDPTSQSQISFEDAPSASPIVVTYQAGMLPHSIRAAMMLIIGHLYEHREENTDLALKTLPMGVEKFLRRYRFDIQANYRTGY